MRYLLLCGVALSACAADPITSASAKPVVCGAGYIRQGNHCVLIPTPTPAPTPTPTPTPPPVSTAVPVYGNLVQAVQPCIGSYVPDTLVVGKRYKVIGLAGVKPAPGIDPTVNSGVILNPEIDDGVHRGDGWEGLWVPFECVTVI